MLQVITLTGRVMDHSPVGTIVEVRNEYTPKNGKEVQISFAYVAVRDEDNDYAVGDLVYAEGRLIGNDQGSPLRDHAGAPVFILKASTLNNLGKAAEDRKDVLKALIVGNLGGDPVTRYTQSGKAVISASIAANTNLGVDGKETVWFKLTQWGEEGALAEAHKGSFLIVRGNVRYDPETGGPPSWVDKTTGELRSGFELNAYYIRALKGGTGNGNGEAKKEEEEIPF